MSKPPVCGRVLDGIECTEVGDHFCEPRANHAIKFFHEILLHTKGKYARRKFILAAWQRDEIVSPLFGTTEWSDEQQCYRRRYRIAWIEIARKQGKTELLAGIMLYLLFADGEYSAELYGIAKDRKQASLCFDVAAQMVRLSPILSKRAKVIPSTKRIIKFDTNSVYQVIASDAAGALGSNPSGVAADEILAWPNDGMWDSMRTGMGSMARVQPLMVAATTAGYDTESFGGVMHTEMQSVLDDPARAPHVFVFMRNTPMDADPWDETVWPFANPALGDFLSLEEMRNMALEARNSPAREQAFRQLNLNQWQNSAFRWMPMHLFDDVAVKGDVYETAIEAREAFNGRECWFGLDLASRQDLCSICYVFPDDDGTLDALWRFWLPETAFQSLNKSNNNRFLKFVQNGWLTVTEGDVLDFEKFYSDIEADAKRFTILGGDADKFASDPVIQEIQNRIDINDIFAYNNTFTHMSDGMHKVMEMVKEKKFRWHGNPLARFCFDSTEARIDRADPDRIRPDKPNRSKVSKRIDGVPAAIMAVNAWNTRGSDVMSVYSSREMLIL